MSLVNQFFTAANVTGPILLLLALGILLKRANAVNDHFIGQGNWLVFNIGLPCLLFLNISTSSISQSFDASLISFSVIVTLITVPIIWLIAPLWVGKSKKGVFVQCAFRGNMAVIGLALCENALGSDIIATVAIYLAVNTIIYNVLSIIMLANNRSAVLPGIIKNPLILAIVAGVLWSALELELPQVLDSSFGYLSRITLPLALICIGGSLSWQSIKTNHKEAIVASTIKLILIPLLAILVATQLNFNQDQLTILFFMLASPTAAAAYVMSNQMTKHGSLAAEIITLSTIISPVTLTIGLISLQLI